MKVGVMAGSTSKRYPPELRDRAVPMVSEIAGDHGSEWAAMGEVARLLGIGTPERVRKWVRQAEVDTGRRPGATTEESAELKRLRRENAELKGANAILKAASTCSRPSSTGHTTERGVHPHPPGPPRSGGPGVGRRADLHCAVQARVANRPVHLLRPPPAGWAAESTPYTRRAIGGRHRSGARRALWRLRRPEGMAAVRWGRGAGPAYVSRAGGKTRSGPPNHGHGCHGSVCGGSWKGSWSNT